MPAWFYYFGAFSKNFLSPLIFLIFMFMLNSSCRNWCIAFTPELSLTFDGISCANTADMMCPPVLVPSVLNMIFTMNLSSVCMREKEGDWFVAWLLAPIKKVQKSPPIKAYKMKAGQQLSEGSRCLRCFQQSELSGLQFSGKSRHKLFQQIRNNFKKKGTNADERLATHNDF